MLCSRLSFRFKTVYFFGSVVVLWLLLKLLYLIHICLPCLILYYFVTFCYLNQFKMFVSHVGYHNFVFLFVWYILFNISLLDCVILSIYLFVMFCFSVTFLSCFVSLTFLSVLSFHVCVNFSCFWLPFVFHVFSLLVYPITPPTPFRNRHHCYLIMLEERVLNDRPRMLGSPCWVVSCAMWVMTLMTWARMMSNKRSGISRCSQSSVSVDIIS